MPTLRYLVSVCCILPFLMGQTPSQEGLDYILRIHRRLIISPPPHWHLVVEDEPCPYHLADLGSYLRIVCILIVFTVLTVISSHHYNCFQYNLVDET
jgi:hypothetical protein